MTKQEEVPSKRLGKISDRELEQRISRLCSDLDKFEAEHTIEEIADFYCGLTREDLILIIKAFNKKDSFSEGTKGVMTGKL